jgi:cytidine deaminase
VVNAMSNVGISGGALIGAHELAAGPVPALALTGAILVAAALLLHTVPFPRAIPSAWRPQRQPSRRRRDGTPDKLRATAQEAAKAAYVPYSHFPVGAAALTPSGGMFRGCNVENASYGMTLCAEATLIGSLRVNGGSGIGIICASTPEGRILAPCGRCRQMILEIGGPGAQVDLGDCIATIEDLLPRGFRGEDMAT